MNIHVHVTLWTLFVHETTYYTCEAWSLYECAHTQKVNSKWFTFPDDFPVEMLRNEHLSLLKSTEAQTTRQHTTVQDSIIIVDSIIIIIVVAFYTMELDSGTLFLLLSKFAPGPQSFLSVHSQSKVPQIFPRYHPLHCQVPVASGMHKCRSW